MLNRCHTEHLPDKCLPSSFPWDDDKGFLSLADDRWRIWKVPLSHLGKTIASSVGFFFFLRRSESRQGFGALLNPFLRDSFLLLLWFCPNITDLYILFCVLTEHPFWLPAPLRFCSDKPGWKERADEKCLFSLQWYSGHALKTHDPLHSLSWLLWFICRGCYFYSFISSYCRLCETY